MRRAMIVAMMMLGVSAAAQAQTRQSKPQPRPARPFVEHGFITFGAGMHAAADELSEHVEFEANVETGTLDATYSRRTGVLFDGGGGFRIHKTIGVGVAISRASKSGSAEITAAIPHPFFDDRHRVVNGQAPDLTRTETAVHGQLYYDLNPRGRWRAKLFAGPSYFKIEQELVTEVEAVESFPFDTAEFGRALTARASGSALGFHGGVDVARMFTRRVGAGVLIRYGRANVDLDGAASGTISTTAGGFQMAAGMRMLW